ncbi:hypothetical protein D3C72_2219970 [compost metagenome]
MAGEPSRGQGVAACRRQAAHGIEPGIEQHHTGIQALGPAALERQFRIDLLPAAAFLADQRVGGQHHVVEGDLREMRVASQVADRAHRDARRVQVDDKLR